MKNVKPSPDKLTGTIYKMIMLLGLTESQYNDLLNEYALQYLERKGINKIERLKGINHTLFFWAWYNNMVAAVNVKFITSFFKCKKRVLKNKSELMVMYKTKLSKINSYPDGMVVIECLEEIENLKNAIREGIKTVKGQSSKGSKKYKET